MSTPEHWAIYIDIEGSSALFRQEPYKFHQRVNALGSAIVSIAGRVYPNFPDRLFVYQTGGDGFLIVSDCFMGFPAIPIAVTVTLMQAVLVAGGVAKGGISTGDFADVQGCYNFSRSGQCIDGRPDMGEGLFVPFPVMGTALVNAYKIASDSPRGARLAFDNSIQANLPEGVVLTAQCGNLNIIDWVHTRTQEMGRIAKDAGLSLQNPDELERLLRDYVRNAGDSVACDWQVNTLSLNGVRWSANG